MKKMFTLAAALVAVLTLNAVTTKKYGFVIDANPWNYETTAKSTTVLSGEITVSATSQWGEYKLSDKAIDMSLYKGYKVVYAAYNPGTPKDGKQGMQLKMEGTPETLNAYKDLPEDATEVTGDFKGTEGSITTFTLQAKTADASINIKSVSLIKHDGTEEEIHYGGVAWGCKQTGGTVLISPAPMPCEITYTGQWGSLKLASTDGKTATFTKGSGEVQAFKILFSEPTTIDMCVEADNDSKGIAWFNIPVGSTEFGFTIDETTVPEDVVNIYIKASKADAVYPSTVKFASIESVITSPTGVDGLKALKKSERKTAYNVAGQQVGKSYKGLVIVDGKKYVRK